METKKIISIFKDISKIPRVSGNEEEIAGWLCKWAIERRFTHTKDGANNVVIEVPASAGYENAPVLMLQSHMDMVGAKTHDSDHDFAKDPIKIIEYEEDGKKWLKADKTTLGADDGVGMAIALAFADSANPHPALELVFTTEEETGLSGASNLDPVLINSKRMINIDYETLGKFCVGCGGAQGFDLSLPLKRIAPEKSQFMITCSGLKGGHTGGAIDKGRANAIKIIARIIENLDARIVEINGGQAMNAVPTDCTAVIETDEPDIYDMVDLLKDEFMRTDPDMEVDTRMVETRVDALDDESTKKVINLLLALPDGVLRMSEESENLVDTSINLGVVETTEDLEITLMARSSKLSRLDSVASQVKAIADLVGALVKEGDSFPPWDADFNSPFLKKVVDTYEKLSGKKAKVVVTHAGLECGVIKQKKLGLDPISMGPDMEGCHTPDERLDVDGVGEFYKFFKALIAELKE